MKARWPLAAAVLAGLALTLCSNSPAAAPVPEKTHKNKRLLLVTDSGGFVHDSVGLAESLLKELGPKNGYEVTAWRFTREPDEKVLEEYGKSFRRATGLTIEKESMGRINKDTLKNFDVVLFFTTGNPLTTSELADLEEWVKEGGAFAGTHCATDTLYKTSYGGLVGGYFDGHPWTQKITLKVEDPKHPAAAGFKTGDVIDDEIYQFRDTPYSREKLHIILSVDNASIDVSKGNRKDKDYAISWGQEYGKGKSFYTSLGHRKAVWKDERYQKHLFGGLNWATGVLPGDVTPSAKKSSGQ